MTDEKKLVTPTLVKKDPYRHYLLLWRAAEPVPPGVTIDGKPIGVIGERQVREPAPSCNLLGYYNERPDIQPPPGFRVIQMQVLRDLEVVVPLAAKEAGVRFQEMPPEQYQGARNGR